MNTGNLNNTEPYHVYVDINIKNVDESEDSKPAILKFNEARANPIIQNPSDYFFSIVRFSLDTPNLPLFIPRIKTGQSNPNLTVYSVSLDWTYLGTVYTQKQNIIYSTQQQDAPLPNEPLVSQDLQSDYYFVYNNDHFINLVNQAFTDCYLGLQAQIIGAGGILPSNNAPFIEYDPNSSFCILNADISGYDQEAVNPINIYFNTSLYQLFRSFQSLRIGHNSTNEKNYKLLIKNIRNSNIFLLNGVNYLQLYQNYETTSLWCPVSSLVFTTGGIPVNNSLQLQPLLIGKDDRLLTGGVSSITLPALTDFEVPLDGGNIDWLPSVFYQPSGEYRLFDLVSNQPLNQIQISVFWKDTAGQIHPFYLSPGANATIKLMFRRKSYNIPVEPFLS